MSYLIISPEQVLGGSSQRSSLAMKLPVLSRQDHRKPSEKPSGDNFVFITSASGCVGVSGSEWEALPEREAALSFWRHMGVFILLLCLLLGTFRNGSFNRSAFLCLWSQSDCAVLPQRTGCLESSSPGRSLALPVRGALLAPLLATLVLQSAGFFCWQIERRPFGPDCRPAVLAGFCKTGRLRGIQRCSRDTDTHRCYNDFWAVGLAFTVLLVFFSFLSDFAKRSSVFMREPICAQTGLGSGHGCGGWGDAACPSFDCGQRILRPFA